MPQQVLVVSGEAGGTFLRSSVYITDCPSIRCLTVKRQTQSIWLMRMVILSCLCWEFLSKCVSHSVLSDSATPWTVACQAPLSMGFSQQENWSRLPCSPPGDLPHPRIQPESLHCRRILYPWATEEAPHMGLYLDTILFHCYIYYDCTHNTILIIIT